MIDPRTNPLALKLPELPTPIVTVQEALGWVRDLINHLMQARTELNNAVTTNEKIKAEARLFVRHGQVLGVLMVLLRCGRIDSGMYAKLWSAVRTLEPKLLKSGDPKIPPALLSDQEAITWVEELATRVVQIRSELNVIIPNDRVSTIKMQKKAARKFYENYGSTLGVLLAIYRCDRIGAVGYTMLRERIVNTLAPSVVGFVKRLRA